MTCFGLTVAARSTRLRKDSSNHLAQRDWKGLIQGIANLGMRINPEKREHSRGDIVGPHRVARRISPDLVRRPVHPAALDAAAGQKCRVTLRPMIAPSHVVDPRR